MAGIRRAVGRDGWEGWATATVGGRRVRRHIRGRTRAEVTEAVRTAEAEWRNSASGDVLPGGDRVTVSAWLTSWIAGRTSSVRPKTLVGYQLDHKWRIDRAIGGMHLGKLTPEHVEKLYAAMAERGLWSGTILHVRRTLSAALATAVAGGRLARNVVRLAVVPRDDPPEIEPLTLVEAQAIANVAAERRNGARWLVALASGFGRARCSACSGRTLTGTPARHRCDARCNAGLGGTAVPRARRAYGDRRIARWPPVAGWWRR